MKKNKVEGILCVDLVSTFNEYLIIIELDLYIYMQLDACHKQHPYLLLQQL